MLARLVNSRPYLLLGLLYAGLLVVARLLILPSSTYGTYPNLLGAGLLLDLTVWPLIAFHWLIARPRQWPVWRVGLVGAALLRLALVWLPNVPTSAGIGWSVLVGLPEGSVLVAGLLRIKAIVRAYRVLRPTHNVPDALRAALTAVFGDRLTYLIMAEGEVLYYACWGWRIPAHVPAGATPLTSYRTSGQLALLWGLLGISLIEMSAVHVALRQWSPTVALWVTLFSLYGCLIILALISTIRKRPSYSTPDALHLRLDLRWQAIIPRTQIAAITPAAEKLSKESNGLNTSLLTQPNQLITLHEPVTLTGLYGTKKTVSSITVFFDEKL
jgi:hypothetical protein